MSKAKCRNCDTIVESKHRHDFQQCKCFRNEVDTRGFYLDGSDIYCRVGGNFEDVLWLPEEKKLNQSL